jgi:hypothetical protein
MYGPLAAHLPILVALAINRLIAGAWVTQRLGVHNDGAIAKQLYCLVPLRDHVGAVHCLAHQLANVTHCGPEHTCAAAAAAEVKPADRVCYTLWQHIQRAVVLLRHMLVGYSTNRPAAPLLQLAAPAPAGSKGIDFGHAPGTSTSLTARLLHVWHALQR